MRQEATQGIVQAIANQGGHLAVGTGVVSTIAAYVLKAEPYLVELATIMSIVSCGFAIRWYAQRTGRHPHEQEPPQ